MRTAALAAVIVAAWLVAAVLLAVLVGRAVDDRDRWGPPPT